MIGEPALHTSTPFGGSAFFLLKRHKEIENRTETEREKEVESNRKRDKLKKSFVHHQCCG